MDNDGGFRAAVEAQVARVVDILCSRQRKYGDGNIRSYGAHGLLMRMEDKLARLKNDHAACPAFGQCAPAPAHGDEARDDGYLDMAGYAIIGLLCNTDTWYTDAARAKCETHDSGETQFKYRSPAGTQCYIGAESVAVNVPSVLYECGWCKRAYPTVYQAKQCEENERRTDYYNSPG